MTILSDSCPTCFPRPCGEPPYRVMCKRNVEGHPANYLESEAARQSLATIIRFGQEKTPEELADDVLSHLRFRMRGQKVS